MPAAVSNARGMLTTWVFAIDKMARNVATSAPFRAHIVGGAVAVGATRRVRQMPEEKARVTPHHLHCDVVETRIGVSGCGFVEAYGAVYHTVGY